MDLGGVQVDAVEALHSGFRPPLGPTAPAIGFVIRGTRSVYFAGDTDMFPGMADLGPIDLALIPVWGWGPTLGRGLHLDPLRAAEALRLIRPRAAVPIHWGTYWPHAMGRVFPDGWWSPRRPSWSTRRSWPRTSGCCRPPSAIPSRRSTGLLVVATSDHD